MWSNKETCAKAHRDWVKGSMCLLFKAKEQPVDQTIKYVVDKGEVWEGPHRYWVKGWIGFPKQK
jgi:hypothetical protein